MNQTMIRRSFKLGVVLVAALAVNASRGAAATSDVWITAKTKMALLTDAGLSQIHVNVDTVDGRVVLHGRLGSEADTAKTVSARLSALATAHDVTGVRQVPSAADRLTAAVLARGVPGVRAVQNDLRLKY